MAIGRIARWKLSEADFGGAGEVVSGLAGR